MEELPVEACFQRSRVVGNAFQDRLPLEEAETCPFHLELVAGDEISLSGQPVVNLRQRAAGGVEREAEAFVLKDIRN